VFQKSEDVDEEDEWLGLIRTLKQEIKGYFASLSKKIEQEIASVIAKIATKAELKTEIEVMKDEIASVNTKIESMGT
jgi:DNA replication initiation complex subunit (GINS family)